MAITTEQKQQLTNEILEKIEGSFLHDKNIIVPTNNGHAQVKLKMTGCREIKFSDTGNGLRAKSKNDEKEQCYEKFIEAFGSRMFIHDKEIYLITEQEEGQVHLSLTVPRETVNAAAAASPEKYQEKFNQAQSTELTQEELDEVKNLLSKLGY